MNDSIDIKRFELMKDDSILLIVDLQERLMPAMQKPKAVLDRAKLLIQAAREFQIPIIYTEQNPTKLGETVEELRSDLVACQASYFEKLEFTSISHEVKQLLKDSGKTRIVVAGVEAHVCVLQTVRSLMRRGYYVHVVADGISSRSVYNKEIAIELMRDMGATITSAESVVFDWLKQAGTPSFKVLSKSIKEMESDI